MAMESLPAATLSRNTTEELKFTSIDQVLGIEAIPVALGIYFVSGRSRGSILSAKEERFRSRATTPRVNSPNQAV